MNILKRILNRFRKAEVNKTQPSAPVDELKEKPWLQSLSLAMLTRTDGEHRLVNPLRLPELPPGVLPKELPAEIQLAKDEYPAMLTANDDGSALPINSWFNSFGGYGASLGFKGYPYLATLAQLNEYYMPCEVIAEEMTRRWLMFTTVGERKKDKKKAEKIAAITKEFERLNVRSHCKLAKLHDLQFGCGNIYIGIKGQNEDGIQGMPLKISPETIKKGDLEYLTVIDPYWVAPFSYNANEPWKPDFYKCSSFFVMSRKTHASRLLRIIGHPLPDLLKPAYNMGGMSLIQLLIPFVEQWLKTRNSISATLSNFSTSILKTAMAATLSKANNDNGESVFQRAAFFNNVRDNRGLMVLDKDTEDFGQVNTPLSGLSELQAQALEHQCYASRIPLVKLVGLSPAGLNASSEGELRVFYDAIRAGQISDFNPIIEKLLPLVQLNLFGEVDPDISFEWVPLYDPTMKELAEIRKSDADVGVELIESGVISPDEERERLQSDPNSGYKNLDGEAPGPPEDQNSELEQQALRFHPGSQDEMPHGFG